MLTLSTVHYSLTLYTNILNRITALVCLYMYLLDGDFVGFEMCATYEQYKQARKEADKICKVKRKQWLNNKIEQVEEAHKRNDRKFFFLDIRAFQNDISPYICL